MLKSKQAALQNKTIVHPAPAPLSTDYLDRINQTPASERSEIENHVHDVINEFESGVGRKATQAEVASIISSVTNHTSETIEDMHDGDSDMDYDGDHNHDSIAKKQVKLLTENNNLSLAEDELALAEAQFEMMSKQLSLAADLHGDEKRRDSMLSDMNGLNEDRYVHEVNEGLGEDYRDSPWLMPSVAKALQHRRYAMFASGHAPLCRTGQHDLASFGSGIALYLKFLKALSICFTVMTVLSLPAYFFATAGSKIAVEDRDAFGFGMISLGNIGDSLDSNIADQIIINGTIVENTELKVPTVPTVLGYPEYRINAANASLIVVCCDIMGCLVFLVMALWLKTEIIQAELGSGKETLSASDYTVYVRGLPTDATKQEITAHFSNLFALDRPDWSFPGYLWCLHIFNKKSRLPEDITDKGTTMYDEEGNEVLLVQTVTFGKTTSIDNTRDDLYLGTWIAETTIIHPNSDLIKQHQKQKKIDLKLKQARAHVKRYSKDTSAKEGPNEIKEKKFVALVEKLDAHHVHAKHSVKRHQSRVDYKMKACSGAFVTFQHEESFLRALQDYNGSTRCCGRLFQPNALRFRPKRGTANPKQHLVPLVVVQADEPTNIIWEHLNTTTNEINIRRCCTVFPCLLFLVIAMLVVFYVQQQGKIFKESTPSISACSLDIPATYMDTYEAVTSIALEESTAESSTESSEKNEKKQKYSQEEDGTNKLIPYYNRTKSEACATGSFYISYTNSTLNVSGWTLLNAIDFQRGVDDINYTSTATISCVNPCVNPNDATTCPTRACESNPDSKLCRSFTKNSVVGCYCKGRLEIALQKDGYNQDMLDRFKRDTGGLCDVFLQQYLANIGLGVGMTVLIVVVNMILRILLAMLARSEHHHSEGAEASAISIKVFAATFMNTALTMLIVNSAFQNVLPSILPAIGIGNGEFFDFTTGWYARVGSAFCMTMLFNTVTPNILIWLRLCCLDECKRTKMRKDAVTQRQLNMSYSGAVFKLEYRYPTLLNVIFVTLTYSSGMPILYPIAACTFSIMYMTDKIALLRLYNRPPMYKASLAKLTLNILPIAIVLHLCIAVWMYGASSFASHPVTYGNTTYTMSTVSTDMLLNEGMNGNTTISMVDQFNIFDRIERMNGLLPFLLLLFIMTYFVLKILVWWWVVWITTCFCKVITCGHCGSSSSIVPTRKFLPGYTEPHIVVVKDHQSGGRLTLVEKEQGWVEKVSDNGILQRYKVWMEDGALHGLRHHKGDKKKTWEVIRDSALHTYDIKENPNYSDAFGNRRSSMSAAAGAAAGAGV